VAHDRRAIEPDVLLGVPIPAATDLFISLFSSIVIRRTGRGPGALRPASLQRTADAARNRLPTSPLAWAAPLHRRESRDVRDRDAPRRHVATVPAHPLSDEEPHIEARINYRLRSDLLMNVALR